MRIATSQMYDIPRSRMASLTAQSDKLQTQISTGSMIQTASDNPAAWNRLQGLNRDAANDTAWSANIKLAQSNLAQTDSTLEGVEAQLQRAQELTLQASTGTLNATDRTAIATELSAITDQLLSLANAKDARGQPLFGGAEGDAAYTKAADGTISYAGTGTPSAIPIGEGSSVTPGVTGDRAFGAMFETLKSVTDALNAGQTPPGNAIANLQASTDSVAGARASAGARAVRVDLEADRLSDAKVDRAATVEALDGTDIPSTVTELQKTLTILQATQASFSKLTSMSLFDYLR
jgi:flagellar hook-associated protein 3 FlgL